GGEDGPSSVDPTVNTENVGDNPLEATALGLKNLDRVIDMLPSATTELGEDFSLMQDTYKTILKHRSNWLNHVAKLVGGVVEYRTLGGRGSDTFTRLPKETQQQAVKFLLEHAFTTPKPLLQPSIVNRFKYIGVADDVMSQQKSHMENLLSARRFKLLMDAEVVGPEQAYPALQFLTDVQDGLWSELKMTTPVVDVIRRSLQRNYLAHLKDELNPKESTATPKLPFPVPDDGGPVFGASTSGTDFRAVGRAALKQLADRVDVAILRTQDAMTRAHLQDCRREIDLILDPKK
ncbi:MAG: zinc-dependent metalloprotease, partial [Gemmataceae bacterium]|nr:zinc-dependent metalloprotease [Gemmataceae bacterium]